MNWKQGLWIQSLGHLALNVETIYEHSVILWKNIDSQ